MIWMFLGAFGIRRRRRYSPQQLRRAEVRAFIDMLEHEVVGVDDFLAATRAPGELPRR
jgi:hypothetical protein